MSNSDIKSFRLDADLLTLRCLVAIADEGTFSAAARRVGRTQSAVSLQIAKLEERLQVKLLERNSRSIQQTPAGELLIAYARRILSLADEAAMALSAPKEGGNFRIGFAAYLAPDFLHELLATFRRAHPLVSIELRLGTGNDLRAALDNGELDVLVAGPDAGENGVVLMQEPLVWAAQQGHHLDVSEPVPLVLMGSSCSYRRNALQTLEKSDLSWRVSTQANAIQGVQSALKAGLGVSVMPKSAVSEGLTVLQDPGLPELPMTGMYAYEPASKHPLSERFVSFLSDGFTA